MFSRAVKRPSLRGRLIVAAMLLAPVVALAAQTHSPDTPGTVVITRLSPPAFALGAVAEGEVDGEVALEIGKDGSVKSAEYVGGPTILEKASLDSARQSQFACGGCTADETPYTLTYAFLFQMVPGAPCACFQPARIANQSTAQQGTRIVTTVQYIPECDCVIGKIRKVRSGKCLYLWKCGRRTKLM